MTILKNTYSVWVLTLLFILLWGCSEDNNCPTGISGEIPLPDYSDIEAASLALEYSPALLPVPDIYHRIHNDLQTIRDSFPHMAKIEHYQILTLGKITIRLTEDAATAYEAGKYSGLDSLNEIYGLIRQIHINKVSSDFYLSMVFSQVYHPESLAVIYKGAEGVNGAWGGGFRPGGGNRITVELPYYTFSLGWGDCPAGCIFRHNWKYYASKDSLALVEESGEPVPPGFWNDPPNY